MSEVTTVAFAVPSEHALEFQRRAYELLAALTAEPAPGSADRAGFTPLTSSEVRGVDVWKLQGWSSDDDERARWLARELPAHPRQVLEHLCRNADAWVTGGEIAERLGMKGAKSVPPSFKSMANRCRRANRRPMWAYDVQNGYRVSATIADLFLPELERLG
jgi:hypothetical protein